MSRTVYVLDEHTSLDNYKLSMSLVVPRPIAWISTYNDDGSANLAPYALFAVVSTDPMIVQFASRAPKDSYHNAIRRGGFVVNIASVDQQPLVAKTSIEFPYGHSEADEVGVETYRAPHVNAPMVQGCSAAFECETYDTAQVGGSVVTYGLVKTIHTDPAIIAEDGMADFAKLNPLSKLGRKEWGATRAFT